MEKPTFQQRMKDLGLFLWNQETKEFLGRGGRSWVEIGIFYFFFYGCLTGFFIATIAVFYETLDKDTPKLLGDSSLLRGNPGMGYLPKIDNDSTLIRVSWDKMEKYAQSITDMLKEYEDEANLNGANCTGLDKARLNDDKPCKFSYSELTKECNKNNSYGMANGNPCVLLKLNKVFGWTPKPWTVEEVKTVSRVPDNIKEQYTPDLIWVDCHGENLADKDNLKSVDNLKYYPSQGFPVAFYPYKKQKDYRPPLVFVQFINVTRYAAEIGLFYLVYYACLAGFFAATIAVFYETIDADNPRLQGDSSLLKGNPGMGFQPMPDNDTTLVYSRSKKELNTDYVKAIKNVLAVYEKNNFKNTNCSDVKSPRPDEDDACAFDFDALTSQCTADNDFGMRDHKPCVLLKLNKIYGWIPEVWKKEEVDGSNLPQHIKNTYTDDRIWIDCHGENPADVDNLGDIEYYPQQGFPLAFYPYKKQKNYQSPLVFVRFTNVTKYVGIMIECKALAKNIIVDRSEKEGSVHFELLVED